MYTKSLSSCEIALRKLLLFDCNGKRKSCSSIIRIGNYDIQELSPLNNSLSNPLISIFTMKGVESELLQRKSLTVSILISHLKPLSPRPGFRILTYPL